MGTMNFDDADLLTKLKNKNHLHLTLVTGNGFDIHHRLPTKYDQFLRFIIYIIHEKPDNLKLKNKLENENLLKFENNEKYKFCLKGIKIFQSESKELLNDDTFIDFILYLDNNNNNNEKWIDFEEEIKTIINDTVDFNLNPAHSYNKFIDGLHNFDIMNLNVSNLEFLFNLYLTKIIKLFIELNLEKLKNQKINVLELTNYQINFNYTNTFNKLYNKEEINTFYVHGKSSEEKNNIIFGYNCNINELKNSTEENHIIFSKIFKRFEKNTDYNCINILKEKYREYEEVGRTLKRNHLKKSVIIFFGHSLSINDKDILEEIFTINAIFLVYYHAKKEKAILLKNIILILGISKVEKMFKDKKLQLLDIDGIEETLRDIIINN